MFDQKVVMVTGGTGSFGKKFIDTVLLNHSNLKKLIVFSRDEMKQFELRQKYPQDKYPQIRYFIGDVRDRARVTQACEGVDIIIHAAAMKQVDTAEYNPTECIRTNIDGAENVINAALQTGVQDVVALSTDKACAPINLYGASKLASDKLFVAANNIAGSKNIRFSVVRYGNVLGSRGSVIPFFMEKRNQGYLPITHHEMTRFNILLQDGINLVLFALQNHLGGEIFIPKISSYKILDVAKAVAPDCEIKLVGVRPGEKIHEEMITNTDSYNTIDLGKYYIILPSVLLKFKMEEYLEHHNAKKVPTGFEFNSKTNTEWETVDSLRNLIREHVDKNFRI